MKLILCLLAIVECLFADSNFPNSIFQKSRLNPTDSITLTNQQDDILPMYSEIQIYRNGKKIFNYVNKDLEIRGYNFAIFAENYNEKEFTDYIFKCDDRPSPDKYLVIRSKRDTTVLLGITDNNTASIFGDIDLDGFFEIGGLTGWIEGDSKPSISIIKIDTGFPKCMNLEKCIKLNLANTKKKK